MGVIEAIVTSKKGRWFLWQTFGLQVICIFNLGIIENFFIVPEVLIV